MNVHGYTEYFSNKVSNALVELVEHISRMSSALCKLGTARGAFMLPVPRETVEFLRADSFPLLLHVCPGLTRALCSYTLTSKIRNNTAEKMISVISDNQRRGVELMLCSNRLPPKQW